LTLELYIPAYICTIGKPFDYGFEFEYKKERMTGQHIDLYDFRVKLRLTRTVGSKPRIVVTVMLTCLWKVWAWWIWRHDFCPRSAPDERDWVDVCDAYAYAM
jgi:hypothetical protein